MRNYKTSLAKSMIFCTIFTFYAISVRTETTTLLPPTTPPASTETEYATEDSFNIQTDAHASDAEDNYVPASVNAYDKFSWEYLKKIIASESENVVTSPFSIQILLAMLKEAAGNNTQTEKELLKVVGFINSTENLRGSYKKMLLSLKTKNPSFTLNIETKIFTDEFIEPKQKFAALLENFYYTDIERLDFRDAEKTADHINSWCKNATNGNLGDIVTKESIQNSVLLLVNAIYFNGLWRLQFNETYEGVFFRTPKEQTRVQYMELTDYFYYYSSNNTKFLRLPYKGKRFSMFILLPQTDVSVEEFMQNMESYEIKRMQFSMEETKLKVILPKFKFQFENDLKNPLSALGISEIFTDNASLPGLDRGGNVSGKLKVSNIIQKSGIEVSEKGTAAFAATVVHFENKGGFDEDDPEVTVNRPFIFFIEEEATGNILFSGKVLQP